MTAAPVDPNHPNLDPTPIAYDGQRLDGKVVVVFGASSGIGPPPSAGSPGRGPEWSPSPAADAWDETMAVNLRGVALCLKHELRAFRPRAAKAAVNHLTRSAAVGYGPDGIRVNAIAPGPAEPW